MKTLNIYILILIKYIISDPICKESEKYCKKCNPLTNICAICDKKDILIPDSNGGCVGAKNCMPGRNYCKECNQIGDLCNNCELSYFPDKNGGCTNTQYCNLSYKGECFECEDDYILIGSTNLKHCKFKLDEDFKNCQKINYLNGKCESCEENYFFNEGDKLCSKIENCFESIFGNCILCNNGFYLNLRDGKCINKTETNFTLCKQTLDGKNCDMCDDGYYFDENDNCVNSNFCSESSEGICKKCKNGYYLTKDNSCTNVENCINADKDTGICSLCMEKYYLDDIDYKCKSNLEENNYKYCSKVVNDECTACDGGYYLTNDKKCVSTKNCDEAENGECILCSKKYYLGLDGYCSIYEHCIYTGYNGRCIECEDGYYFSNRFSSCLEYEYETNETFIGCKYSNYYDEYCLECKNNYYFNYNISLCLDNSQEGPLYKCAYSDDYGEVCDVCIDGYFLGIEDKKCSLIEDCRRSENEYKCLECDEYYCLDKYRQQCIGNDYLEDENILFYYACKETNEDGTACEKCIEGYEVSEKGYCIDVDNCIERIDGKCLKCREDRIEDSEGFGIYFCANDVYGCAETTYPYCLKCNNLQKIYYCTECVDGYTLGSYGQCFKESNNSE